MYNVYTYCSSKHREGISGIQSQSGQCKIYVNTQTASLYVVHTCTLYLPEYVRGVTLKSLDRFMILYIPHCTQPVSTCCQDLCVYRVLQRYMYVRVHVYKNRPIAHSFKEKTPYIGPLDMYIIHVYITSRPILHLMGGVRA